MVAVVATPGASKPLSKRDAQIAMRAARDRDRAVQDAYEMGQAGEKLTFSPDDPEELRDAHRRGLDERAKARRRRVAAQSGGYLAGGARRLADRTPELTSTFSGDGGSIVGILVGALALIALFILLNRSQVAADAIGVVTRSLTWLVSPDVLPF